MLKFLFNIFIIIAFTFGTEFFAYKFIRRIDKKERKKLQDWELDYIKKLKNLNGDQE